MPLREELVRNILADIAVVNYVPFDSDTIGNPALDVGDIIAFSGGQADSTKYACITANSIKIGGRQTIKCVGKNPKLSQAKSKNDKNISGLLSQVEAAKIGIHTFTNASAFTVNDTDVKIISIEFASSEENHAQFFGQIIVNAQADAVSKSASAKGDVVIPAADIVSAVGTAAEETEPGDDVTVSVELPVEWTEDGQAIAYVTFELNDEVVEIHHPMETWHSGMHTMLLYYPIEKIVANYTNTFNVYLRMTSGSATIDVGGCVASISGQAMGAAAAWDGTLKLSETVSRFGVGNTLATKVLTDVMKLEYDKIHKESLSETITGRRSIGAFGRPFV